MTNMVLQLPLAATILVLTIRYLKSGETSTSFKSRHLNSLDHFQLATQKNMNSYPD